MRPTVFISYATPDRELAAELASALDGAGLKPWLDVREIAPGDSTVGRMNEGIGSAGYVVLLVSAAARASRWVNREWMAALAQEGTVIIPVLLDDSGLPPLLKDILHIDARQDRARAAVELLRFFGKEVQKPSPLNVRDAGTSQTKLARLNRRQLRLVAAHCLDSAGLDAFCFDARISPNELRGESVNERIVALLHGVARDGLLNKFSVWLELERSRCVSHQLTELEATPGWGWAAET